MTINCPKCERKTSFTISDAIDSEGETFRCQHCGWYFCYTKFLKKLCEKEEDL